MALPQKKPVPVYLRGIPAEVVREAKAQAARRGVTLAGYVADTLVRAMEQPSHRASEAHVVESAPRHDEDLEAEARWFESNRDRLARKYAGEFIAIVNQRVVDHDDSFDALAKRVFKLRGPRDTFMPQLKVGGQTLRLRSPRLARNA